MGNKSHFFRQSEGGVNLQKNLYLGGVGSFFTNELLLSQNLGVLETDISNFQIDANNNISCFVAGDYTIGNMQASIIGNILTYVIGGDNLKTISSTCFLGQTNLVFFKADNLENPLNRRWFWSTNIEESYLPNVVLFGSQDSTYAYRNNTSLKNVYIPLATQLGTTQSSSPFIDRFFEGADNLENIYVNPFLMTNNNGQPDANLTRATQLYGTNIIPVTDLTPPQTITDLSISNITLNSFDVNFTPPTSINGILRYDVYVVNDSEDKLQEFRKYQSINNSGDTITGLQSGVNYKVRIQTKNNFFTNSEISSEVNVTTQAFNLVAQYDFNNGLVDSIGGNNGIGTDITFNNGTFGNEAVFNGTTSQVLTPNSTVWDISNGTNDIPIKIEVLVKFGIQSNQYVLAKCPNGGSGWEILKFGSQVFVNIYDNLTTGFIQIACDVQTDSNGYSLIEFSYDGSGVSDGLDISVNGVSDALLKGSNSYTKAEVVNANTTFGRAERRIDRFLNGAISQIKVYK